MDNNPSTLSQETLIPQKNTQDQGQLQTSIAKLELARKASLLLSLIILAGMTSLVLLKEANIWPASNSGQLPSVYLSEDDKASFWDKLAANLDETNWNKIVTRDSVNLISKTKEADKTTQTIKITSTKTENDLAQFVQDTIAQKEANKDKNEFQLFNKTDLNIEGTNFSVITYKQKNIADVQTYAQLSTLKNGEVFTITANNVATESAQLSEPVTQVLNSLVSTNSKVKGTQTASAEEQIVNLYKPSIVRLYADHCGEISYSLDKLHYLPKKKYPYCAGGLGSGYFVNAKGYIATNGHVVKANQKDILVYSIMTGQNKDFIADYYRELLLNQARRIGLSPSQAVYNRIEELVKSDMDKLLEMPDALLEMSANVMDDVKNDYAKLEEKSDDIYAQIGKTTLEVDEKGVLQNKDNLLKAEMVEANFDTSIFEEKSEIVGPDIALLKVADGDYPTVRLGSIENLNSGASILIMGYPGVGTENSLVDSSSANELTATRGIVSGMKKAKGTDTTMIQTDASVAPGNSGGPGFDANGDVIGTVTYALMGMEKGGNYNYLRDIKELKDLMAKNNVENVGGTLDKNWKQALVDFRDQKYKKSVQLLAGIAKAYPEHVSLDTFMGMANDKIEKGEDRSYFYSDPYVMKVLTIGGVCLVISLGAFAGVTMTIKRKKTALSNETDPQSLATV